MSSHSRFIPLATLSLLSLISFALLTSYSPLESKPVELTHALKSGSIRMEAISNGKFSGRSILLSISNLKKNEMSILIPAGTLYHPSDDKEQTLIQLEDQLFVLGEGETTNQLVAGFCTESSDNCPSKENVFTLGITKDPKLKKLIGYLKNKEIDKSTYQEAVWAITDAHSISAIHSEKSDLRDFRTFMADLTGQKDTWFSSPQRYAIDDRGTIQRETVRITGELTFDSDGESPIHQEICDEDGNVLFTSSASTPRKSKDVKMRFSVRVQGWEKGNYFVKIMDEDKEMKRFDFVIA